MHFKNMKCTTKHVDFRYIGNHCDIQSKFIGRRAYTYEKSTKLKCAVLCPSTLPPYIACNSSKSLENIAFSFRERV